MRFCLLAILLFAVRCDSNDGGGGHVGVPGYAALEPFIVEAVTGRTIYTNSDVDSAVFSYETATNEARFWSAIRQRAFAAGWKETGDTSIHVFERFTPSTGAFSGSEELRLVRRGNVVFVAWVQSDHQGNPVPVQQSSEGRFAQQNVWPVFEALVKSAG